MKLGILLIIFVAIIVFWFATLPIVQILRLLPYGVEIDWSKLGISFTIAFFCGGISFVWGQNRIKKARQKPT